MADPVVNKIAKAKKKSAAQVILAWHIQRKCIPLCKTTKEERLLENISASYDFKLTKEEVKKIDALDAGKRLFNPIYMKGFDWNNMPYYD